jgi:hypothetical protein
VNSGIGNDDGLTGHAGMVSVAAASLRGKSPMKRLALLAVSFLFATFAAWADPSGTYDVKGVDLDGKQYHGELQVAKVGDVYSLTYTFDDSTVQEGSAIGDDEFLAYGYGDNEELGVGLMTGKDGNWEGVWTNLGASKMSTETWTKK